MPGVLDRGQIDSIRRHHPAAGAATVDVLMSDEIYRQFL